MEQDTNVNGENGGERFKFDLCTNGHCFLCLKLLKAKSLPKMNLPLSTSLYVQNLCKHLNINLGKIMSEMISTPTISSEAGMAAMERSDVSVSLCKSCGEMTGKFSSLFQKLESIQMEVDHCLREIHREIVQGEENTNLINLYQQKMSKNFHSLMLLGFIAELKKEISSKCSSTKFCPTTAQVKLSTVTNPSSRLPKTTPCPNSSNPSVSSPNKVKCDLCNKKFAGMANLNLHKKKKHCMEVASSISSLHHDHCITTSRPQQSQFLSKNRSNIPTPRQTKPKKKVTFAPSLTKNNEKVVKSKSMCGGEVFVLDNKTRKIRRKFKCYDSTCKKLFGSQGVAYNHYKFTHLKHPRPKPPQQNTADKPGQNQNALVESNVPSTSGLVSSSEEYVKDDLTGKYQCPSCDKQYSSRKGAKIHNETAHLQIRQKCNLCNRSFIYLDKHKQKCKGPTPAQVLSRCTRTKASSVATKVKTAQKKIRSRRSSEDSYFTFDIETGSYHCTFSGCKKIFRSKFSVITHFKGVHLKRSKYKCSFCNVQFLYQSKLRRHKEVCDGGENPGEPKMECHDGNANPEVASASVNNEPNQTGEFSGGESHEVGHILGGEDIGMEEIFGASITPSFFLSSDADTDVSSYLDLVYSRE